MKLKVGSPEEAGVSPTRCKKIYERAEGWVEDGIHPALVILAARRGIVFLHEAFGRLGPEHDAQELKLDAIFPLASHTKQITATAVMILVEDGLLGLNRPVVDYIPEFVGEDKDLVLIRHLLTHTSGLSDDYVLEELKNLGVECDDHFPARWISQNLDEYVNTIIGIPLWKLPDTEMQYADSNFDLLGDVIQRVSGIGLEDFTSQRIFIPLEMKDTYLVVPDDVKTRVIRRSKSVPWYEGALALLKTPLGCGGAYSTAYDMAIFGQMLLNGGTYGDTRILSHASVTAMTRNQIPGISAQFLDRRFPEASWGYGWSVTSEYKGQCYGEAMLSSSSVSHGGAGGIMQWVDLGQDVVGIYFSVLTEMLEGDRKKWCADLFMNMVSASIEDL
jgi:CubicO group peptidase (beta-lactamase class C family)